jgi:hypothetical protein
MVQEKVLLCKEILLLSGKNLTILCRQKETTFLISGIRFTYKFIIPDIKTIQNNFFVIFEILTNVLLILINWLLKPKCMLKYFFLVYEKHNMIFFSFETFGRMHKNIFFLFSKCFVFLKVLMKTGYFNTRFVLLRCI